MAKNKMKSHRGACKRMKLTGSGKIKRNKAYKSHILTKKAPKRKRGLRKATILTHADTKRILRAMARQFSLGGKKHGKSKKGVNAHKRHKKILKLAKGYYGSKSKTFKAANPAVMRALRSAYVGRKLKKRQYRQMWIARINAAARMNEISYSQLMNGLKKSGIEINRKMLSEMAIYDAAAFAQLCETAKKAVK